MKIKKRKKFLSFLIDHVSPYASWTGKEKIEKEDDIDQVFEKLKDNAEVGFKIKFKF